MNKQIYWRCRRGMLEVDLFLIPFFEQQFESLSIEQQAAFVSILDKPDPELLNLLMGYEVADEVDRDIVQRIRLFKQKRDCS
ncbi:MAG: succinate dehydrogenase assembly factor 2 [Gammaproteobacteria bacterium]